MSSVPSSESINKVVRLLAGGKAVFGIFSGEKTAEQGARIVENKETDFVFYSMEEGPFDIPQMKLYMGAMRDAAGSQRENEHPLLLRIPPIRDGREAARERVRLALEAGVHGIVFPHVESAEEARIAVSSMRYADSRHSGPRGTRPAGTGSAPAYWGISEGEYRSKADLWPLNPEGQLVNMLLIEDQIGVQNAREIVSTPGVSVVCPGPGDLRRAYSGDATAIENAIQTVLSACKEFGVTCCITAGPDDIELRLEQGFRLIIVTRPAGLAVGRKAAGREP